MSQWTLPPNLERRWKQHVRSQTQTFFAVVAPGFTGQASLELSWLGIDNQMEDGGLSFQGKFEDLWKAHALARIPTRFQMRLLNFRALRFEKLRDVAKKFPWELYLRPDLPILVKVNTRDSKLWHHEAVQETALQAIRARMRETYPDFEYRDFGRPQVVHLRMFKEEAQFSLDATGESLYIRGYDKWIADAPLRDNLAFGCLMTVGLGPWDVIADPCAGSGTFALEYFLRLSGPLPGRLRRFAFQDWLGFKDASYQNLLKRLEEQYLNQWDMPKLHLRDRNPKALDVAKRNLAQLEIPAHFQEADLLKAKAPELGSQQSGLLISNLPYGDRLHIPGKEGAFFKSIGRSLGQNWQGWHFALILPEGACEKALGLPIERRITFSNGGIPVACIIGKVPRDKVAQLPRVDERYADHNTFDY